MTDAECQEAMDKVEEVRYIGRNPRPRHSGQTGWIIGRQMSIRGTTLWSVEIMKSTIRCTADLLQQVVAGSSPPLHSFKVGDHVLYTGSTNRRIPYGTPGTVQGLIPGGSLVQVLFPSHPPASGGKTWDVSIIRLQHAAPTTPTATPAQAPTQAPPAFQVGDHVIFVSTKPSFILPGTKGKIVRVITPSIAYEVDFPANPCQPGTSWVISHQELQHYPAPPPAVPLTYGAPLAKAGSIAGPPVQATSLTLPSFASWTGYEKLTIHRSQSAAPPRPIAHHPHVCPRCKGPAYIGFSTIECADKACR